MPVGFKNGTDGTVQIAIDAVRSSAHPHQFLSVTKQGISAIVATTGNDACHIILRGSSQGPNYDQVTVDGLADRLAGDGLPRRLMIDFSHGNSEKDHNRQPAVAAAVAAQLADGSQNIFGVMMESHLLEGRQALVAGQAHTYGQSIPDACLSSATTVEVLAQLAAAQQGGGAAPTEPAPAAAAPAAAEPEPVAVETPEEPAAAEPMSSVDDLLSFDLDAMLSDIATDITPAKPAWRVDRKSTRLNSSPVVISYAVFCLKKRRLCC